MISWSELNLRTALLEKIKNNTVINENEIIDLFKDIKKITDSTYLILYKTKLLISILNLLKKEEMDSYLELINIQKDDPVLKISLSKPIKNYEFDLLWKFIDMVIEKFLSTSFLDRSRYQHIKEKNQRLGLNNTLQTMTIDYIAQVVTITSFVSFLIKEIVEHISYLLTIIDKYEPNAQETILKTIRLPETLHQKLEPYLCYMKEVSYDIHDGSQLQT